MSLGYTFRSAPIVVFGTKVDGIRAASSLQLTTSYVAADTTTISIGGMSKAEFYILYTMGPGEDSNSVEIKIEMSPDGTYLYQTVNDATSTDTSTLTKREFTFVGISNTAEAAFTLPFDIQGRFMTVSAKETGTATTAGSIYAEVILLGEK